MEQSKARLYKYNGNKGMYRRAENIRGIKFRDFAFEPTFSRF